MLWHSFGSISALVQEITSTYWFLSPPTLTGKIFPPRNSPEVTVKLNFLAVYQGNRVCNALALLQCVASHPETKIPLLHSSIPTLLFPFMEMKSKLPCPYLNILRVTSLSVIGALVKEDHHNSIVVPVLLSTEIIPICLYILEKNEELSQTVAAFIIQKILMDDIGLAYVCHTFERFSKICLSLASLETQLKIAFLNFL